METNNSLKSAKTSLHQKNVEKTRISIVPEIMRIDTRTETIDMQQIDNRRFMYDPKREILVLGRQYEETSLINASHAVELAEVGITEGYDAFVRGWIGTGGDFPKGVIHFAPCIDVRNNELYNRAFDTLKMFEKNGIMCETVIRGFGEKWEQPVSDILPGIFQPDYSAEEISNSFGDLFVFIRSESQILRISEGTGGNLLDEDTEAGYVDYIDYEQYSVEAGFPEVDGGNIMMEEYVRDKYNQLVDCIPDVLEFAYGKRHMEYTVLCMV